MKQDQPPHLYTGPRVLVPLNVEALVVTNLIHKEKNFSTASRNYVSLSRYGSLGPMPFTYSTGGAHPVVGVTLHWVLPDALKHGQSPGKGNTHITFPLVPNRWLVVRYAPPDKNNSNKRALTAWVIQSDYLGNGGTNSFAEPGVVPLEPTMIGKSTPLESWQGEQEESRLFLDANGSGQVTFNAFTADIFNVFAFEDDLSTVQLPPGRLTYLVAGWYSDPEKDILAPGTSETRWKEIMDILKWQVHQPQTPEYPTQLLCHGMVYDVFWHGPDYKELCTDDEKPLMGVPVTSQTFSDACPGQKTVKAEIAVGHTPLDALASLVQYQLDLAPDPPAYDARRLLEAFFYDELNDYRSPQVDLRLNEKIRQTWFHSTPGGSWWSVVAAENPNPITGKETTPPPILTTEQREKLIALNQAQQTLDQREQELTSLQRELYQLEWKIGRGKSPFTTPPPPQSILNQVEEAGEAVKESVQTLLGDVNTRGSIKQAEKARDDARTALAQILGHQLNIVQNNLPRFWHPAEPVLLITGAQANFKHGPDGRLQDDGTLFCRLTGQTLTGITLLYNPTQKTMTLVPYPDTDSCKNPVQDNCAVIDNTLLQLSLPNPGKLPPEIAALLVETWLLDTRNGEAMVDMALEQMQKSVSPEEKNQLVTQVQDQQRKFATVPLFISPPLMLVADTGKPFIEPSPIAVSPWQAPWSPLYMDWKITWYPAPDNPDLWDFNHNSGTPLHYQWKGKLLTENGITLNGRTLLTPNAAEQLGIQLKDRLDKSPPLIDSKELRDLVDRFKNWDILAQSLSGFNDQLVQLIQDFLPLPQVRDLLGDTAPVIPIPGSTDLKNLPPFFPLRAGQLALKELRIVDDFGQVYDPIEGADAVSMIAGPEVGLNKDGTMEPPDTPPREVTRTLFPPRIIQDTRLLFRFVSGSDDNREIDIDPADTPVCGYLLHNYLDKSLGVYDDRGNFLGSLFKVGGENTLLHWEPNPEQRVSVGQPPQIANSHLAGIVNGLLSQPNNATAFDNLLRELDKTITKLAPVGPRENQNLANLMGRPIAVVRAKLKFEFAGLPLYNQAWEKTGRKDTGGIEKVPFTVRLGGLQLPHDGLYGYFVNSDYHKFHVVYKDPDLLPNNEPYITPGNISLTCGETKATYVTMLIEPYSSVYAITGILPDKIISLPGYYSQAAVQNMAVTFRTGPLLTPAEQLRMVRPSKIYGHWTWIEHSGINITTQPIANTDTRAVLPGTPPGIRQGWLKLTGALKNDTGNKGDTNKPQVIGESYYEEK
ncbi:MAG: hypothetical protein PVH61_11905 [Candidatus Aminicenantes bacterium]